MLIWSSTTSQLPSTLDTHTLVERVGRFTPPNISPWPWPITTTSHTGPFWLCPYPWSMQPSSGLIKTKSRWPAPSLNYRSWQPTRNQRAGPIYLRCDALNYVKKNWTFLMKLGKKQNIRFYHPTKKMKTAWSWGWRSNVPRGAMKATWRRSSPPSVHALMKNN